MPPETPNPYKGPEPFGKDDSSRFFGREMAIKKLVDYVQSQSIVVLYGKSGTGKTSLLNAGIIPRLDALGWSKIFVHPPVRFNSKSPDETYSNVAARTLVPRLVDDTSRSNELADLLPRQSNRQSERVSDSVDEISLRLFVFDQFEELFTVEPSAWEDRLRFIRDIDAVVSRIPGYHILIVIREDFIADLLRLTPYMRHGIDVRYQLLELTEGEAKEAIAEPANAEGYTFTADALKTITTGLRRIDHEVANGSGSSEFVSPLLLQLVCQSLWEQFTADQREIDKSAIERLLNIDTSVREYFSTAVGNVTQSTDWSDAELVKKIVQAFTSASQRIPVYVNDREVGGLPIEIVDNLAKQHVLRREIGSQGGIFYELAHDRFVAAALQTRQALTTPDAMDADIEAGTVRASEVEREYMQETYVPSTEESTAVKIWNDVRALTRRGSVSVGQALEITSRAIAALVAQPDALDSVFEGIRIETMLSAVQGTEAQEVAKVISKHITTTSASSLKDTYYWILNQAAKSRPHAFNDIFTTFGVGSLMMALLAPDGGSVYDPHCHSGELFGYLERELRLVRNRQHIVTAVDRFAESREVVEGTLHVAQLQGVFTSRDALTAKGDTQHDYVFCNPPFNDKAVDWDNIPEGMRPFGTSGNANLAWLQHIYVSLKANGRAVFLMPSSLASSGEPILSALLQRGALEAIVDIGEDRFFRGVPAHIWLLNRAREGQEQPVLFLDMSALAVQKRPRLLTDQHIELAKNKVVAFRAAVDAGEVESESPSEDGISAVVDVRSILEAGSPNLSPKTYVARHVQDEPVRDIKELIEEYQSLKTASDRLDRQVRTVLDQLSKRL
ncbi:MAG: hypothetical protein DCC55_35125 [Chloroflexi bacterium]|nr:MAG: hypothetical protein DCC55_35125 [Chloroflexota bacterium]